MSAARDPREVVWFNRNFSSLYNILRLIRAGDAEGRFFLLCTHDNPEFVAFAAADAREVEPASGTDDAAYVDYCLDVCRRHGVTLFWPGRKTAALLRAERRFAREGVRLLACASPAVLEVLEHKGVFYDALRDADLPLPRYRRVATPEAFRGAVRQLRAELPEKRMLCFKPARGLYGQGFHILDESAGSPPDALFSGGVRLAPDAVERLLQGVAAFQETLVMEYLEGPEYSVDCLALDGRLVRATVRRKPERPGGCEVLEYRPALENVAARLTRRFQLTGIFNLQARDGDGVTKVLEINPRMAGGLYYSCLGGVNYPYWRLRLACDPAAEKALPAQKLGLKTHQYCAPFIFSGDAVPTGD